MFIKKLQLSAMLGVALSLLGMFAALSEGKGIRAAFGMIPGGMLLALLLVFWFTRNMHDEGGDYSVSTDHDIAKLHRDLRKAIDSATLAESQGHRQAAAYWRSQAAIIESNLRRLGA